MLLSPIRRAEANLAYAELLPAVEQWSGQLPTFLCRQALGLANDSENGDPFIGRSRPKIAELDACFGSIKVVAGVDLNSYFTQVDLRGHFGSTQPINDLRSLSHQALALLADLSRDACQSIVDWTGQIVWLDFSRSSGRTKLTSSTFPALPHCTFVTSKALRHIPPTNVQISDSIYCLAENLFHESLHQSLSTWLTVGKALNSEYDSRTAVPISVPWRGQSWEPDRVLHAAYVYAGILPLRISAMDAGLVDSASIAEGREAFSYLKGQLPNCRSVLDEEHQGIIAEISAVSI